MNASPKVLAVALTIAVAPWLAAPAAATPLSSSLSLQGAAAAAGPPVETVQYRRGWRGAYRGGYRRGFGGAGIGIVAGAIVGGAIAASQPYGYGYSSYGPGYDQGYVDQGYVNQGYVVSPGGEGGDVAYFQQRFRSYDVRSGTYLGFDGLRHSCP